MRQRYDCLQRRRSWSVWALLSAATPLNAVRDFTTTFGAARSGKRRYTAATVSPALSTTARTTAKNMREKAPVQFGAATESASPSVKSIATDAMVAIVAASCYRRPMATSPTIPRTDLQRVLPTFRKAAALIDVHPSFISRAVRDLGITPVEWGRRERYLQIPDVLLIATHARRNAVEEVAGGLVELAEEHDPELAGWV